MTVPPRSWSAASNAEAAELAREWLASPELRRLSEGLDGPSGPAYATSDLRRWSAEALDTRGGRERHDAIPVPSSESRRALLLDLAEAWGMLDTAPPLESSYTATVLLGGTATANRLRTDLAARCGNEGTALGTIVAATAERAISDRERVEEPGTWVSSTEPENLEWNLERGFGPLVPQESESGGGGSRAWKDATFFARDGRLVRSLVAPADEGRLRANTLDVLRFMVQRIPADECRRLLLVTSALYVPYQFFVAAPALLTAGSDHVELVGTRTAGDRGSDQLAQRPAQETHAAIQAAVAVIKKSASSGPGSL